MSVAAPVADQTSAADPAAEPATTLGPEGWAKAVAVLSKVTKKTRTESRM